MYYYIIFQKGSAVFLLYILSSTSQRAVQSGFLSKVTSTSLILTGSCQVGATAWSAWSIVLHQRLL